MVGRRRDARRRGFGFSHSTYIIAVQSSVDYQQRGIATSTLYFSRMLGQAIGAALFGAIVNAGLRAGSPDTPKWSRRSWIPFAARHSKPTLSAN